MTGDNQSIQTTNRRRRFNGMFASKAGVALQVSALLVLATLAFVLIRGLEQTLSNKDSVIKKQAAVIETLGGDASRQLNQMMAAKPPGQDRKQFLSELIQAQKEIAGLRQDRECLAKTTKILEKIKGELHKVDVGKNVEHAVNRLIGIATELVKHDEALGSSSGLRSKINELSDLLVLRDNETRKTRRKTKRITESLQRVMERAKKVTQLPPCWSNPQTKKQEYIFDIALLNGGFRVRDRKSPHRVTEQAALPIKGLKLNTFINWKSFLAQTRKLFAWSKVKDCRFFVRAFDGTGAQDKAAYKAGMRILEQRFYKYEVRDEKFTRLEKKRVPVARQRPKPPKPIINRPVKPVKPIKPVKEPAAVAPRPQPAPTLAPNPEPVPAAKKVTPSTGKQKPKTDAEDDDYPFKSLLKVFGFGK